MKKRLMVLAALVAAAITVVAGSAMASSPTKASVIYNTIPASSPSNMPSVGAEAYAFNEFGNEINLGGSARHLNSVTVTLSSWACGSGAWYTGDCSTTPGQTFNQDMTLNIYNPSMDGGLTHGTLIASSTNTFHVPYRPSASPKCTGANAGEWYQSSPKMCFNGLTTNVIFSFPTTAAVLPNTVVYGIVYNTQDYGPTPTHVSGPADSLNIALATKPAGVGSETNPGAVWQNSPSSGLYCDGGLAGTGSFRLDSPTSACWAPYLPAVQFTAS